MQLKSLLLTVLLILILVGFLTYAYSTYTLYSETKAVTGAEHVTAGKMFYIMSLLLYLAKFSIGGVLVYKGV